MSGAPIIVADNLHKQYVLSKTNRVHALRGASLQVQRGELLALTGPSGSGKSTLLHVLGLLDRIDSGRIEIAGEDVSALGGKAAASLRARRIGFVFQQFNLLPELNALENVALPAEYAGASRSQALLRARELLEMVGLAERTSHQPVELSGGQQQRVALARALVNDPAIVLADEPTGDLDTQTSKEMMGMIRELNSSRDQTFVIVTHDPEVAAACSRRLEVVDGLVRDH